MVPGTSIENNTTYRVVGVKGSKAVKVSEERKFIPWLHTR